MRRLEAEPEVSDVALTQGPPGEEGTMWVEVEGVPTPAITSQAVREGTGGHRVGSGHVALDFFETFEVPLLAGRQFDAGDLGAGATAVVANRTFVRDLLGGGNAIGRRVRYVGRGGDVNPDELELGAWHEIVGVVEGGCVASTSAGRAPIARLWPHKMHAQGPTTETIARDGLAKRAGDDDQQEAHHEVHSEHLPERDPWMSVIKHDRIG